jgi:hypothetical protein
MNTNGWRGVPDLGLLAWCEDSPGNMVLDCAAEMRTEQRTIAPEAYTDFRRL